MPKEKTKEQEKSLLDKIRSAIMSGAGDRRDQYLKELEEYSVNGGKKPKRNK